MSKGSEYTALTTLLGSDELYLWRPSLGSTGSRKATLTNLFGSFSLANLGTRSAGDLNSGTLLDARLSANVTLIDGSRPFTAVVGGVDPTQNNHLATKSYVDALSNGLQVKAPVRVATTANTTLSGAQTIDGVSVIAGDRVLVKDQSTGAENGIYVCASGAWSRSTDADASVEVKSGLSVWVNEGTANSDSQWVLTTNDPIVIDTTALVFTQGSGLGQIGAGSGLTKTGNTLNVGGTANRITVGTDSVDINTSLLPSPLAGDVNKFLKASGADSAAWNALAAGDIPDLSATYQPLAANLTQIGALADPNADRILFWDDSAGSFAFLTVGSGLDLTGTTLTATGGSGDVVGPAGATDNALARYDTTTGKLIQDSPITLSDLGAFSFPDNVRQTFNPGANAAGLNVGSLAGDPDTPVNGDLWYDSTANELTARINGANVTLGVGAGANAALSNLAAVSINASLIPQTTLDLGAAATAWRDLYLYGGGTFGSHSLKLTGTPTANRTVTIPDATDTLAMLGQAQVFSVAQQFTPASGVAIRLGGATSSFPGLKRDTTYVQIRLADDSTFGNIVASVGSIATLNAGGTLGNLMANGALSVLTSGGALKAFINTGVDAVSSDLQRVWRNGTDINSGANDFGIARSGVNVGKITNASTGGGGLEISGAGASNGQILAVNSVSENTTLSTGGATTDTVIQLPANSFIVSVTARITTSIAGVDSTALQIGDASVATRFGSTGTLTSGTTIVGLNHLQGGVAADNAGPVQVSAASVRLTLSGGGDNTPSGGVVRVTIHYISLTAPTS